MTLDLSQVRPRALALTRNTAIWGHASNRQPPGTARDEAPCDCDCDVTHLRALEDTTGGCSVRRHPTVMRQSRAWRRRTRAGLPPAASLLASLLASSSLPSPPQAPPTRAPRPALPLHCDPTDDPPARPKANRPDPTILPTPQTCAATGLAAIRTASLPPGVPERTSSLPERTSARVPLVGWPFRGGGWLGGWAGEEGSRASLPAPVPSR